MTNWLKNACFNHSDVGKISFLRLTVFLLLAISTVGALFLGVKQLVVRASDPVLYSVCASGCDFVNIASAYGSSTVLAGDIIEVRTGYASELDTDLVINKSSLTLQCENTDVVIGATDAVTYLVNDEGYEGLILKNCTFLNKETWLSTSSVAMDNIFTRTTSTPLLRVRGGGALISGNTFYDNNQDTSFDSLERNVNVMVDAGVASVTVTGNSFTQNSNLAQRSTYGAVWVRGGPIVGEISNNYFVQSVLDTREGAGAGAMVWLEGGGDGDVRMLINHNTFQMVTSTAINVTDVVGKVSNMYVTSTYNIFYNSTDLLTPQDTFLEGIYFWRVDASNTFNIFEDYNNYYNLERSFFDHSAEQDVIISGGHSLVDVNPFFKIGDVDSNNDLHLAPFSPLLDVDGLGGDIGAFSAERIDDIYVDDDGIITYSYSPGTETVSNTINSILFSYGDDIYNQSAGLAGEDGWTLIVVDGGPLMYKDNDYDITAHVNAHPHNWHLSLGYLGSTSTKLTILVPDDIASSSARLEQIACLEESVCWVNSHWVQDVFIYDSGEYSYNAAAVASAGISLYSEDVPAINRVVLATGASSVHATSTADLSFLRDGDTLNLLSGNYGPFTIDKNISLGRTGEGIRVIGSGANSIVSVNTQASGVGLENVNGVRLSNFKINNASSTGDYYYITNPQFSFGGVSYVSSSVLGAADDYYVYILTSSTLSSPVPYNSNVHEISSVVADNPSVDINLCLGKFGTAPIAILLFGVGLENLETSYTELGWVTDVWVTSTFSFSDGEYVLNTDGLVEAGVSLVGGTSAKITHLTSFSGLDFLDADSNLVENVMFEDNGYGIRFRGTSENNTVSSTILTRSSLFDVFQDSGYNNYFKDVDFSRVSSTIHGAGNVNVFFSARARVQDESSVSLAGASVSFTDAQSNNTSLVTDVSGYTPYYYHLPAYTLSSASNALTSGGYNPYLVEVTATSTFSGDSSSGNLSSVNQTFSFTLQASSVLTGTGSSTLSVGSVTLVEGATSSYSIVLVNDEPQQPVLITPTTTNTGISMSPSSLTFTLDDWAIPQVFGLTAIDDNIANGNRTFTITHTASSSDVVYSNAVVPSLTVTITDNDSAGVVVSESASSTAVTEGGATDNYTVVLTSAPTSSVTISISTGSKVSVSPASLSYTSSTWNIPQTVTVTAVDDSNVEGTHTDTISHQAVSSDSNYNGISIASVNVTVTDNDTVAVTGSTGGGGSIFAVPPKLVDDEVFTINNGAKKTVERVVNLHVRAENAIQIAVSEDITFANVGYENFKSDLVWTLSDGFGVKNIFVKLRSAQGGELVMVQSIEYVAGQSADGSGETVAESTGQDSVSVGPIANELIAKFAKNLTKFLSFGSIGDDVSALQEILREYKYFFFSRITKYFGPITQNALKNYQKDNDLVPTGNLDIVTREKIKGEKEVVKLNVEKYNFTNYLTIGSHGDEVRALQVILKDLGYFEYMHVSGMYGPITKAAVTKFQKDHSITPATGSVGPKTRDLLNALE